MRVPGTEGKQKVTFRNFFREDNHSIEKKLGLIRRYHEKFGVPIIDNNNFHKDPDLNDKFKKLHKLWLPHHRYKLSEEIESLLKDDTLLYDYIEFTIQFTNKTRCEFKYRT
ncbi:MAG: hypothetical protein GY749_17600 [Desulfobacteraceae bacterium]|nr:hypothetical protein [Desulfobacteraceae bacterium]